MASSTLRSSAADRTLVTAVSVVLAAAGFASVLLTTRWGIGTSVDSVAYIQGARAVGSGEGTTLLVQHAPLYALLLGAGAALGLDPITGARWLNAVIFGVNISLVGLLIRQVVTHLDWAWVLGSTAMLVLVPMWTVHVTALSEPLFLMCMLSGFWFLAHYLERPSARGLASAAALTALTLLARYAGIACILTGVVAIVFLARRPWRLRVRDAVVFGLIATAPMAVWMARNVLTVGSATGRDVSFHPAGLSHAWQALYTVSSWLLIPPAAPDALRFAVGLVIGGATVLGVVRCVKTSAGVPTLVAVLVIFTAVYGAFLATSISFLDANTPLDDRILLPILAVALVLGCYLLDVLWPLLRRVPLVAYGTLGVVMVLTGGHALRASTFAVAAHEKGWGFSSEAWRQSPTLTYAAQMDAHVPLFSNAPEIVYLHTGRQVRGLPRARFLMNQQPNRAFATELAEVRDEVQRSCGAIVYLRNLAQQSSASEAELKQQLSLNVLRDERDGAIWGATGCRW